MSTDLTASGGDTATTVPVSDVTAGTAPDAVQDSVVAENTATEPVEATAATGEVDAEPGGEAPEHSSPEQVSRWGKLRNKAETAEKRVTELEAKAAEFAPLEGVRDHAVGIVAGLTAPEPSGEAIVTHLHAIDPEGANVLAGYILTEYGTYRDNAIYGANPDEIRAALQAFRGQVPVSQPNGYDQGYELQGQQAPQQGALAGLPASVAEDWDLLSPETQNYFLERERQSQAFERQRLNEQQQRDAQVTAVAVEAYQGQFYPMIQHEIKEWGVTEPEGQIAFWKGVEASIDNVATDRQAIESAKRLAAQNRQYAANSQSPAIENILRRHIGLVGNALYKQRQAGQLAGTEALKARVNGTAPSHIAGSAGAAATGGQDWDKQPLKDRLDAIFREGR